MSLKLKSYNLRHGLCRIQINLTLIDNFKSVSELPLILFLKGSLDDCGSSFNATKEILKKLILKKMMKKMKWTQKKGKTIYKMMMKSKSNMSTIYKLLNFTELNNYC